MNRASIVPRLESLFYKVFIDLTELSLRQRAAAGLKRERQNVAASFRS